MADDDRLSFADGPRSELDRTLDELLERAARVQVTQGRLRALLRANRAVVEQLDLEHVLRSIAEAAVSLVDARYGALGVIGPDGHLEQFIHVGIPTEQATLIGHLPAGHGLLGAVVDDAAPIRLGHIEGDARSAGFPAHHPPMSTFLGVPIRVRNVVFGNLYLTNKASGPFTQEDEELVTALAATAGIAIENARLFDDAKRRERWSSALAEVTSSLLSDNSGDFVTVVADSVASAIDADLVCVVVPIGESDGIVVETARGSSAASVRGRTFSRAGTLAGRALDTGSLASSDGADAGAQFEWEPAVGPSVAVPLRASGHVLGVLTISRPQGAPRFTDSELGMASDFAAQASVAIELARARGDRSRLALADDRSRIARDLHDNVIQRLFASGMALQTAAARLEEPERGTVIAQVDMIDSAIADIRTAIFTITSRPGRSGLTLRHRVLDVVAEMMPGLTSTPRVTFGGAVDLLVPNEIADDIVAVAREALTNVARHSGSDTSSIDVTVHDGGVSVTVTDAGCGIDPDQVRSSGLANLAERAHRRGGVFDLVPGEASGTRLMWTVPLGVSA